MIDIAGLIYYSLAIVNGLQQIEAVNSTGWALPVTANHTARHVGVTKHVTDRQRGIRKG